MATFTNLDRFFLYVFLPILICYALLGSRHYFRNKVPTQHQPAKEKKYIISRDLVYGNLLAGVIFLLMVSFLFLYVLNIQLIQDVKWELITLLTILLLSFPFGLGIGAHLTAITLETTLPDALGKEFTAFKRALHYFHYPFSHRWPASSVMMILYLLTLLDMFKGEILQLDQRQALIPVIAGIILGAIAAIIFIITKIQKLMLYITLTILGSLLVVAINEQRRIVVHPVALLFTSMYLVIALGLFAQKQTKVNLRRPVKKWVRAWLGWDIDQI